MVQAKTSQDHCRGVKAERKQQKEVIDAVILAKAFAPEKDGIDHAQAVYNNSKGEQVSVSVLLGEPGHKNKGNPVPEPGKQQVRIWFFERDAYLSTNATHRAGRRDEVGFADVVTSLFLPNNFFEPIGDF